MPDETVDGADDQVEDSSTVVSGSEDDTNSGQSTDEPTPGSPDESAGQEDDTDQPLTDEEIEALRNNPEELRKAVMRGRDYTRKTTQLARLRDFGEAFSRDPRGVVRRLAAQVGMQLPDEPGSGSGAPPDPVRDARDKIAEVLGEKAADVLVPILQSLADRSTAPLATRVDELSGQTALAQAESVIETFTAQVPDWKKFEPAMVKLSQEISPRKGMDPLKWMRHLYTLASQGASNADRARKLVDRVTTSVRGSDSRTAGTQSSRVNQTPNRPPTFDEAWSAAVRGKRLEF